MPTVSGFTAARMLAMDNASIVDAELVGNDLILITRGGSQINVGRVKGDSGETGLAMTEIGAGVDLDTISTAGYRIQSEDAEATVALNYPVAYQGMLYVTVNPGGNLVWQTYSITGNGPLNGTIWTRTKSSGVWSRWNGIGSKGWQPLPFSSGWSNYGTTYTGGEYLVDGSIVRLRGLVKTATALSAASTIAIIPAPFRPLIRELYCVGINHSITSGASSAANTGGASAGTAHTHTMAHTHILTNYAGRVDVTALGEVIVTLSAVTPLAAGGWVSLEGIYWDWTE